MALGTLGLSLELAKRVEAQVGSRTGGGCPELPVLFELSGAVIKRRKKKLNVPGYSGFPAGPYEVGPAIRLERSAEPCKKEKGPPRRPGPTRSEEKVRRARNPPQGQHKAGKPAGLQARPLLRQPGSWKKKTQKAWIGRNQPHPPRKTPSRMNQSYREGEQKRRLEEHLTKQHSRGEKKHRIGPP